MTAAAASNWGLVMNVVNSIVGVSVLTMPFCFKQCGIILGALLLIFCSWMTHQSCMFLVKSASLSKRRTYAGLAFHAYGKAGKMLVETSMIGLMLGTCITFYVVIGDLGSGFFARLFGCQVTGTFRVVLLFVVSLCIVLPLSLQRNMVSSIQSFSAMALIFYTVFMLVIVLSSFKHGLFGGQWLQRVSYFRWEGLFRCIPIFGMSFACQSQVLPTYDSLDEPSVKTMSSIFASSLNVVTTFYIMVGFFGYVSFMEATAGNVLTHFPSNLVTEMARVGFVMSVAVGFPMMILPCRQALSTLLFEQQQKDGTFAAGGYMPPLRFKVLTLAVVFGTMVGGIVSPNVETILGLTGATMGSLICFICPALIYRKAHKNAISAQVVLWVGLGVLVVSTVTTLSVSEEPPVDVAKDVIGGGGGGGGRQGEAEGARKMEAARLSVQDPVVDVPGDGREKPKLPVENQELEQAQIKGPAGVPVGEDTQEKLEAAQVDRPGQGIAVPMGEAHRHEPPVPHDQVVVDEGQDGEGPEENELPSRHPGKEAPGDKEQRARALPESQRGEQEPEKREVGARPQQAQALEKAGDLPKGPQQVPEADGQPERDVPRLGGGDAQPGPQELMAVVAGEVEEPAHHALGDARKPTEKAPQQELGGKAPLLAQRPAQGEQKDTEQPGGEQAGSKLEAEIKKIVAEAGRAELLDHAVLLQVIKEQQVQQKRLLDQQEKLLAVIEEQHKEIRQQRQDEDEDKSRPDTQAEPGVAVPRGQKDIQEGPAGEVVEDASRHPWPGVPGGGPTPPQELDQPSRGEVKEAPGRGSDVEPQAAQARLGEQEGAAVPKVGDAGRELELVPRPDPPRAPAIPEQHLAGEVPKLGENGFGGDSQKRKRFGKGAAAAGADTQKEADGPGAGTGARAAGPQVKLRQSSQDLGPAVAPSSGPAEMAPQPQAVLGQQGPQAISDKSQDGLSEARKEAGAGDRAPAPPEQQRAREDATLQEPIRRLDPEPGPRRAAPGGQKPDNAKPNRDLKVQAGADLRRRRRDLAPGPAGKPAPQDGVVINFNPLPDVQVNDLRGALDTQLRQAAGAALQVVRSRQVKQLPGALEEA
ncbi:solute carrier family 38 member 10 isoform 2-T2 [Thomomys bottae]